MSSCALEPAEGGFVPGWAHDSGWKPIVLNGKIQRSQIDIRAQQSAVYLFLSSRNESILHFLSWIKSLEQFCWVSPLNLLLLLLPPPFLWCRKSFNSAFRHVCLSSPLPSIHPSSLLASLPFFDPRRPLFHFMFVRLCWPLQKLLSGASSERPPSSILHLICSN